MNISDVLKGIAPTAATLIGGPFAGLAVKFLGPVLGLSGDATASTENAVKAIGDALTKGQLTGDQIVALKAAEQDLTKHLADNGIKLEELAVQREQIAAADRDSARRREIETKDRTTSVLAAFVTIGFFGVLGFMLFNGKPQTGGDALLVMLGSLGTAWTAIISYYYGSSAGSQNKDRMLYQSQPSP